MSAHDPRNRVIHFGRKRSTSAEIGDPLRPKQVIHFGRNRRSTSSEIRRRGGRVLCGHGDGSVHAPSRHLTPISTAVTTTQKGTCKMVGSPFQVATGSLFMLPLPANTSATERATFMVGLRSMGSSPASLRPPSPPGDHEAASRRGWSSGRSPLPTSADAEAYMLVGLRRSLASSSARTSGKHKKMLTATCAPRPRPSIG